MDCPALIISIPSAVESLDVIDIGVSSVPSNRKGEYEVNFE